MRPYYFSTLFVVSALANLSAEEAASQPAPETTVAQEQPAAEGSWLGVVEDGKGEGSLRVNVRSGEGVNYHILSVLERGAKVRVLGKSGEWLKIELVDAKLPVWISREFVSVLDDATVEVNADRVVLRGAATTKSSSLAIVDKGLKLTLLESHPQWVRVEAPAGVTGYIHAQFVRELSPEPVMASDDQPAPAPTPVITAPAEEGATPDVAAQAPEAAPEPLSDVMKIRKAYEEKIAEIRKERADELAHLQRLGLAGGYLAAGLLVNEEHAGLKITHRIDLGDRTLYYVKSVRDTEGKILIDLDKYSGKKVGIRGRITKNAGPVRIVEVTEVTVLESE